MSLTAFHGSIIDDVSIEHYVREGFCVLPNFIDAQEAARMADLIDRLMAERAGEKDGLFYDLVGTKKSTTADARKNVPQLLAPSRYAPEIRESPCWTKSLLLAQRLLKTDCPIDQLVVRDHSIVKPVGAVSPTPWHQDESYWDADSEYNEVAIWIALQPVTRDMGCMEFVARSHLEPIHPHHYFQGTRALEVDDGVVDPARIVACPLPTGGATVHQSRTLHYTGGNHTQTSRRALIFVIGTPPTKLKTPAQLLLAKGSEGMTTSTKPKPSLFRQVEEISLGSAANSFSELLCHYGALDSRVCYVGVDTMDKEFQSRFPDRAFDVGIAEQNELGVATGLARVGLIPVVQAWSPFTPLRNFEQLRTYLCRHDCNVKIVTTTLGLANCSHGTTHHDLESIALYRTVPNLVVLAAIDDEQFRQAFHAAMKHVGPVVLMGPPEIYAPGADGLPKIDLPPRGAFEIGKAEWLRRGRDAAIISVGAAYRYAWAAAETLAKDEITVSHLNLCAIKPLDAAAIRQAAITHRAVITVEEQNVIGGIGSAVSEVIAEAGIATRFRRIGIPDQFCEELGDYTYTRQRVGLTSEALVKQIRTLLSH